MEYCEECGIVCVVDECFIEFLDEPERFSVMKELRSGRFCRLFILKAFTKLYAMAGLRLGYGISLDRELLEAMDAVASRGVSPVRLSRRARPRLGRRSM